jgi:hypothetical protein
MEVKTKTINGKEIMVTPFTGFISQRYLTKVVKLFGPGIAGVLSGNSMDILNSDLSVFGDAIGRLTDRLDPDELSKFILDLLSMVRINKVEITQESFDLEFQGNLSFMYKILWFVMEVNWGDFFGKSGFGEMISKLKPQSTKSMKGSTRN